MFLLCILLFSKNTFISYLLVFAFIVKTSSSLLLEIEMCIKVFHGKCVKQKYIIVMEYVMGNLRLIGF